MPGKIPAHLSERIVQLGVEAMASCPCRSSKRVWGRYQLNWQHFLQVEGRLAVPGRSLLNVSQRITTIHQASVGSRIHWKDGGCSWHGSQWQCAISASLCMAVQASQFWHFTFVLHSLSQSPTSHRPIVLQDLRQTIRNLSQDVWMPTLIWLRALCLMSFTSLTSTETARSLWKSSPRSSLLMDLFQSCFLKGRR